ncbi:hypothetical protein GCM10023187_50620 [Nibrella viscosa]|uniref:Lipocalin-like domain-containing protein n=1 Tax=Nibrella viscosa TaxID=1084524 RepID=A0ABP8KWA3_9BACT
MKKLFYLALTACLSLPALAQTDASANTFSVKVNGKEWKGKAQRLALPLGLNYIAIAGMSVNPDIQTWVRFVYMDNLKPGTYQIVREADMESKLRSNGMIALVDYTEETGKLGMGFHDGESNEGTVTITKVTDTSIEGTFEAKLKGVYYQKRASAVLTGLGIQNNLEEKAITAAGGGMLVKGDPHEHDNCRKTNKTDEITLTEGTFKVTWNSNQAQKKSK